MYKQIRSVDTNKIFANLICRVSDGACIPFDPDNTDYQKYLEWVAEGNTPDPAE